MIKFGLQSTPLKAVSYERSLDLLERWLDQAASKGPDSLIIMQIDDTRWLVSADHGNKRKSDLQKS